MIAPTIGRVVWFWQNAKQVQPYAAMIAFVHNDRLVNLGYMNEVGAPAGTVRVPLVQEGEELRAARMVEKAPTCRDQFASKPAARARPLLVTP